MACHGFDILEEDVSVPDELLWYYPFIGVASLASCSCPILFAGGYPEVVLELGDGATLCVFEMWTSVGDDARGGRD